MRRAVITGMGVVSPIGSSMDDFGSNLFAGRHGIAPVDRFDVDDLAVRVSAPVRGLKAAQKIPAHELRRLDPFAVFGLLAARQAVEQSGLRGAVDPFRLGVFMSSGLGGTGTLLSETEEMRQWGPRRVSPMLIPRWAPNMVAGVVSIDVGARGASLSHSAACASSAVSIGEGLRAIRHGYADAVICGGSEAIMQKVVLAGFQNLRALTRAVDPDRASIPFDKERGGFVMGEGAGAVVLEDAEHARARGAPALAEVAGYGSTSDASHITAPAEDGEAIVRAISDALSEAGDREDRPPYINAHGTGTVMNDHVEAAAITRAFGEGALVSSTKSMTGHLLGAAGVVETIAAVLALRAGVVPPTVGTVDIDDDMRVDVVRGAPRQVEISRALSLSLGFGGHNVCLVLDRVDT